MIRRGGPLNTRGRESSKTAPLEEARKVDRAGAKEARGTGRQGLPMFQHTELQNRPKNTPASTRGALLGVK